jgi:hypothetical protein
MLNPNEGKSTRIMLLFYLISFLFMSFFSDIQRIYERESLLPVIINGMEMTTQYFIRLVINILTEFLYL